MCRYFLRVLLCGVCLGPIQGCTSTVESRVIQAFSDSLQKENMVGLRKSSSADFDTKALQSDKAIAAFKIVGVPTGKSKVVKVVDKGDAKKVTVEVGEAKRKLLYRLERDPDTNKWVVDDIFLNPKPAPTNKPVSEQMSLLLSARDFIDAWKTGERGPVLGSVTPEFSQLLGELPNAHLANLTKQLAGEVKEPKSVDISEESAELHFSKLSGDLVVVFRKVRNQWKADDAAIESRREGDNIASVRLMAAATSAALTFQSAYNSSDKQALARVCTKKFFDVSLAPADLSLVKLPLARDQQVDAEVKLDGQSATFITHDQGDVVKISLAKQTSEDTSAPLQYLVEEVTIYEMHGKQDKRLSALFTAHAVMQLFSEDLLSRDIQKLQLNSTPDFNHRVWSRVSPATMQQLPMAEINPGQPVVINTVFQGPVTQVTVNQGGGPLTYVLRDHGGRVYVDDVLMPAANRPESLKATLELMIPIFDFSAGFHAAAMEILRANASREFCRTVWNQVDKMPEIAQDPIRFLRAPLSKINLTPDRALIILGDDRYGAKVFLVKERDRYVLDDVLLVAGPETRERQSLKRILRDRLQNGRLAGAPESNEVSQAGNTEPPTLR